MGLPLELKYALPVSPIDNLMKKWSIPDNILTEPFLTPKELQVILGVSLPTIYRLIDKRKLPAFKIGNSIRFIKKDVLAYLESMRIDQLT